MQERITVRRTTRHRCDAADCNGVIGQKYSQGYIYDGEGNLLFGEDNPTFQHLVYYCTTCYKYFAKPKEPDSRTRSLLEILQKKGQ